MIAQIQDLLSHVDLGWLTIAAGLVAQWVRVERRLTKLETRMEDLFKLGRRQRREDLEEFQE